MPWVPSLKKVKLEKLQVTLGDVSRANDREVETETKSQKWPTSPGARVSAAFKGSRSGVCRGGLALGLGAAASGQAPTVRTAFQPGSKGSTGRKFSCKLLQGHRAGGHRAGRYGGLTWSEAAKLPYVLAQVFVKIGLGLGMPRPKCHFVCTQPQDPRAVLFASEELARDKEADRNMSTFKGLYWRLPVLLASVHRVYTVAS